MILRRPVLCFWWQCIKIAHEDGISFANDWQWLIGIPLFAVVWQHFTPLASDVLVVVKDHPILDAVAQAGIAFAITYAAIFVPRLFRAPYKLLEHERERAAKIQALAEASNLEANRVTAIQAQTAEMRATREQRERENDPYIRAFNESKYKDVLSGVAAEEHALGFVIWWIVNRSAWGRWYAAQINTEVGHANVQRTAESVLLGHFEKGTIPARGIRPESPDRSEFIQPDYWQRVYFHVFPDMRTIYRARVFSRAVTSPADSDEIADKAYRVVVCDLPRIAEHFPEVEERTDKQTAELLASRTK